MANVDQGLQSAQPEVFEQYPVASFAIAGNAPIAFPALDIQETGGNRLVKQERPYRDGAKLDDTGAEVRGFRVMALFDNSIDEPGIPADPPLYPTICNRLIEYFAKHETGDLVLPTRGKIRVRAHTYERMESASDRDLARITFVFLEDNEDTVDRASLGEPTVRASSKRLAEQTTFSGYSDGFCDENLNTLTDTLSEIQGLMALPGETVETLEARVRGTRRSIQATRESGEALGRLVGGLFLEPRSGGTHRQLGKLSDQLAQASDERSRSRSRLLAYRVRQSASIYAIAALVKQPADKLIELNAGRIPDLLRIDGGTVIRIYERAP